MSFITKAAAFLFDALLKKEASAQEAGADLFAGPMRVLNNRVELDSPLGAGTFASLGRINAAGREEFTLLASGRNSEGTGTRGGGFKVYGNGDDEHKGFVVVSTGPNDNATAVAIWRHSAAQTILGSGLWNYADAMVRGNWLAGENYVGAMAEPTQAWVQVKDSWGLGDSKTGIYVDHRAKSTAGASTTPHISYGAGWRELTQDLGIGEGVGYGFYGRLVDDTAPVLQALIATRKNTTNDTGPDARRSELVFQLSADGTAAPRDVLAFDPASGVTTASLGLRVTTGAPLLRLLSATGVLNFPSIAAGASGDLTITVTGAVVGDTVMVGLPAAPTAGIVFSGFVSATDTATIRATNITAAAVDPPSATYRATVMGF